MKEIIKLNNIVKSFKNGEVETPVLKGINLTCYSGKICVVLGTSGSGKTTLLNIISGLERPDSGSCLVSGENIEQLNDHQLSLFRRKNVGFVFQQYNLIKDLNVYENVKLSSNLVSKNDNIETILERVGLKESAKLYPYQLSGGMQQRVAIARGVAKDPQILFCDEPTGALDEKSGREVLKLLKELNNQGTTIFMITHNPNIAKMAHQVVHIKNGVIDSCVFNEKVLDVEEIGWG